jgi:hypothetical protein
MICCSEGVGYSLKSDGCQIRPSFEKIRRAYMPSILEDESCEKPMREQPEAFQPRRNYAFNSIL